MKIRTLKINKLMSHLISIRLKFEFIKCDIVLTESSHIVHRAFIVCTIYIYYHFIFQEEIGFILCVFSENTF